MWVYEFSAMLIKPFKHLFCIKYAEVSHMVKTKGIEATVGNWRGAIGGVPAKYKTGVQAATDTIEKAIAAEELYAAKVQEAISNKTRVKGLQKTSTAEWKSRAAELGSARIAAGMTAAEPKFRKGISDVLSTIETVTIADRTADPIANVDGRVKPIVKALYDMKRK